jgi:cell division protease FtsH
MKLGRVAILIAGFLLLAITLSWLAGTIVNQERSWNELQEALQRGAIDKLVLYQDRIIAEQADERFTVYWPGASSLVAVDHLLKGIASLPEDRRPMIDGRPPPYSWLALLVIAALVVLVIVTLRGIRGGFAAFSTRIGNEADPEFLPGIEAIGGIAHAREEIQDLLNYLRDPERFGDIGATMPKGVLLIGPPGTGKTLLAKALAKEAGVSFIHLSGSDFVELFVGVGAARVRGLFKRARKQQPCIVFIDEIDAIAKSRGSGAHPGNQEFEQTLNAILVELDGFDERDRVLVVAATNRLDALDRAVLRPGRFDRHIHVNLPTRDERAEILHIHARKRRLDETIDLDHVAAGTTGFSGADLNNLLNEAAIIAAREHSDRIRPDHLARAEDRILLGHERPMHMDQAMRQRIAYHELGHAIIQAHLPTHRAQLDRVSIVPRSKGSMGVTVMRNQEDVAIRTRGQLLGDMAVLLGGHEAETMMCGDSSTSCSDDLDRVTTLATCMVLEWGMGSRPPRSYRSSIEHQAAHLSGDGLRGDLDRDIDELVTATQQVCRAALQQHREQLEALSTHLVAAEVLDAEAIRAAIPVGVSIARIPSAHDRPVATS